MMFKQNDVTDKLKDDLIEKMDANGMIENPSL